MPNHAPGHVDVYEHRGAKETVLWRHIDERVPTSFLSIYLELLQSRLLLPHIRVTYKIVKPNFHKWLYNKTFTIPINKKKGDADLPAMLGIRLPFAFWDKKWNSVWAFAIQVSQKQVTEFRQLFPDAYNN